MSDFEIASMLHHVRQMDKARLEQERLKQELHVRGIDAKELLAKHRLPMNVIALHQPNVRNSRKMHLQNRDLMGRFARKIA